jgi:DNA-binding MarR family transcriptional regulator
MATGEKRGGRRLHPPAEVEAEDLAQLVAGMSRFLRVLMRAEAFKDSGIGLAEWAALNMLVTEGPRSLRQLGRSVGLGGPMAHQLVEVLMSGGLVSAEGDGRDKLVTITDAGRAELARINQSLQARLAQRMTNKGKLVAAANRIVSRHLIRGLSQPPSTEARGGRNGKREAKKVTSASATQ